MLLPYIRFKGELGKSLILPIDERAQAAADPTLPLTWTTSFRYLGVNITSNVKNFCPFELIPSVTYYQAEAESAG